VIEVTSYKQVIIGRKFQSCKRVRDTDVMEGVVCHHVFDRIHLIESCYEFSALPHDPRFEYFCLDDGSVHYTAFEDDFGPMNLGKMYQFCEIIDQKLKQTDLLVALVSPSDSKDLTNAVFLLGAYMILLLDNDVPTILAYLDTLLRKTIPFKSVSRVSSNFSLHVQDCLAGLQKAKYLGWIDFRHGTFDVSEYNHLDSPLNANLHEVVPGKFVVMRGPRDLPDDLLWRDTAREDGSFSHREFSPRHYADILSQFDVQAVIRLSAPQYDRVGFESAGIAVVDLCCEDGAPPPVVVVAKFLAVTERLPGAVAVHCGSGLGRSGTLVALYMMKHHGFTAREAMGWLRVVRPGR
jgi:cell division cycle 14